jgi:cytochrome c oxidase subunit 4
METKTHQEPADQKIKRGKVHEGPRNHFIAFAVSIILTLLAFLAVYHTGLNKTFTYVFILILAIVQVVFQLVYWMHLKDRGHFYAIMGLLMGAFVGVTAFVMAIYWVWW